MCFVNKAKDPVIQQDPVVRQKADAALTKNVSDDRNKSAFLQNVNTSPYGLVNEGRKTLLGE